MPVIESTQILGKIQMYRILTLVLKSFYLIVWQNFWASDLLIFQKDEESECKKWDIYYLT